MFVLLCGLAVHGRADALAESPTIGFSVACVDLETGKELWTATPRKLGPPTLFISNGELIAESKEAGRDRRFGDYTVHLRYSLDATDGSATEAAYEDLDTALSIDVEPLAKLGGLTDAFGRTFEFERGSTRSLRVIDGSGTTVLRRLEDDLTSLSISGELALFSFGLGEVHAYDVKASKLAWEFDGARRINRHHEDVRVAVISEGATTYVSANEFLFALETKSGSIHWKTRLKSRAGRGGSFTTRFGKSRGKLFAASGDTLFVLTERTGKQLWSYHVGDFGDPWPLVHDGKVFVSTHPRVWVNDAVLPSNHVEAPPRPSALKLVRRGSRYSVTPILRRSIPTGSAIWSLLGPPPSTQAKREDTLVLTLANDEGGTIELDLSRVLRRRSSTTYVKLSGWYDRATLATDDRELASTELR